MGPRKQLGGAIEQRVTLHTTVCSVVKRPEAGSRGPFSARRLLLALSANHLQHAHRATRSQRTCLRLAEFARGAPLQQTKSRASASQGAMGAVWRQFGSEIRARFHWPNGAYLLDTVSIQCSGGGGWGSGNLDRHQGQTLENRCWLLKSMHHIPLGKNPWFIFLMHQLLITHAGSSVRDMLASRSAAIVQASTGACRKVDRSQRQTQIWVCLSLSLGTPLLMRSHLGGPPAKNKHTHIDLQLALGRGGCPSRTIVFWPRPQVLVSAPEAPTHLSWHVIWCSLSGLRLAELRTQKVRAEGASPQNINSTSRR